VISTVQRDVYKDVSEPTGKKFMPFCRCLCRLQVSVQSTF
jgi:hypothetical protein